jgi:hypothetical protein
MGFSAMRMSPPGTTAFDENDRGPIEKGFGERAMVAVAPLIELTREEQMNIMTAWLQGYHLPEHEPAGGLLQYGITRH